MTSVSNLSNKLMVWSVYPFPQHITIVFISISYTGILHEPYNQAITAPITIAIPADPKLAPLVSIPFPWPVKTDGVGVGVGDVMMLLFPFDVDPLFPNPVEFPTPAVLTLDSWHIVSMPCVMGLQKLET